MSQIDDARLDGEVTRPVHYVQIAGFGYRFYSVDAPPTDADYTDIRSVLSVGDVSSKLDSTRGVVTHAPMTVRIFDDKRGGAIAGAARDLRRLRYDGADHTAYLSSSIEATGTADVEVDRDNAGWPATGVLHVGQECLEYTGKAGTGGPGDPFRFTGITRGARGTLQRHHIVDARQGWAPVVTSDVVSWRTRPATVYVRNHRPEGGTGGWVQWMAGFIDSSPSVEANAGITITLRIVPWDALIVSGKLGGDELTFGLAQGYHLFTGGIADRLKMVQRWERGEAVSEKTTGAVLVAAGNLFAPTQAYDDVFDVGLTAGDPRYPALVVSDLGIDDAVPDAITSANEFDMPAGYPAVAIAAGALLTVLNADTSEEYWAKCTTVDDGVEELVEWPGEAIERLNQVRTGAPPAADAFGWGAITNKGDNGMWARVRIDVTNEEHGGPAITAICNSTLQPGHLSVRVAGAFGPAYRLGNHAILGYMLRLANEETNIVRDTSVDAQVPTRARSSRWEVELLVGGKKEAEADRTGKPIGEIAIAGYETGEPVMLVDRLTVATGANWPFAVTWTDYDGKEFEGIFEGEVTGDETNADGEIVGYRLELTDPHQCPSFGDWPGYPQARIRPVAAWRSVDPRTIIAQLLVSVDGAGTNSAYDSMPFGLAIPEDHVDLTQIVTHPIPATASRWTVSITKPTDVQKVIGPMLRSMGAALVMAIDPQTGQRRIRLTQAGLAAATESAGSITSGRWTSSPPASRTDENVVNAWTLKLRTLAETEYTASWTDRDSVIANGETRGSDEDLSALDLELARDGSNVGAQLRPTLNEWRALYAWPRRLLAGDAQSRFVWAFDAGAVLLVTSPYAVQYDGTEGVALVPMRVVEVAHDLDAGTSRITLVYHGGRGAGWAPSLKVATVVSATAITVEANEYSDTQHPITGATQEDLDFWEIGDASMPVPIGAWAGTTRTITAINRGTRRVDFSGAHGLAVGDSVDTVDYSSAPTAHQAFAFLADTDEIVTVGVEAFTYV